MQEITVKLWLSEEDFERLKRIITEYRKQGLDKTIGEMLSFIMNHGSKYTIDEKFKFHEWKLGLREDYI